MLIDGKLISNQIKADLSKEVETLKATYGRAPKLAVILVGENPASVSYVTGKRKALAEAGMSDRSEILPESATEEEILNLIEK